MEDKIKNITEEEFEDILKKILNTQDLKEEEIFKPINNDTIEEILEKLKGADIKDLLRNFGINFEINNNKEQNIKILLNNIHFISNQKEIENIVEKKNEETNNILKIENDKKFNFKEIEEVIKEIEKKRLICELDEVGISNLEVYENMPIKFEDDFSMEKIEDIYLDCVVITNVKNEVLAIGKAIEENETFRLIFNNIKYDLFSNNRNCKILLFEEKSKEFFDSEVLTPSKIYEFNYKVYSVNFKVQFKKLQEAKRPLCIDFGTSNTTVGSYGIKNEDNEIELVEFLDVINNNKESKLYPTIVYIKDCSNSDDIEYLFGYEARKKVIENNYDTEASVFFEIKRWINDIEKFEEVNDEFGNVAKIKRKEIIYAYINHIILSSEQYFKRKFTNLHFTAPVKLKNKFLSELEKMFSKKYTILKDEDSLDEGVAIVYNYIYNVIKRKKEKQQYSYNVDNSKNTSILIIDCGGGTTDLASCNYKFEKIDTGYELYITTQFQNGNSNFGGNNITYRILQLLKIKLANYYCADIETKLDNIIPYTENDILENIDKNNKCIYDKLEEIYSKAEEVIPTRFSDNKKFKFNRDIRNIKRNYYYLWQLAEKIKIEFFQYTDLLAVNFKDNNETNRNIILKDFNKFYIYIVNKESKKLEKKDNIPDISINTKEISKLLYGDIYGLLNDLLKDIKPEEYKNYKLSGQSCKITLFNELLKEFIPGKKMRTTNTLKNKSSENLKLDCINGSIAYIMDKELGNIKPHIHTENPKLIYDIKTERNDEEILSLKHNLKEFEISYYSSKADLSIFKVYDLQNKLIKTVKYNIIHECKDAPILLSEFEKMLKETTILSNESIEKLITKLDETDVNKINKENKVTCIFTVPAKDSYGFNIYQILKFKKENKELYYLFNKTYENFEENLSSQTFFDGKK